MRRIYKIKDLSKWAFGRELKQLAKELRKNDNNDGDIKITITIKDTIWEYIQKKNR